MTAKKGVHLSSRCHPGRRAAPSRYVIPDGPQGRAGIQTGAAQEPLDPRLRGDDSKKGGASLFTMSSRTARGAEPGSRQAPRRRHWIPACAGMTAKGGASLFMASSRTARSAEPGSRRAPCKSRWIPVRAYADAGFPAGMTARTHSRHFLFLVVIPGPPRPEPGIRRRGGLRLAPRERHRRLTAVSADG